MFPHVHQGNLSQIDAQIDMMQEQISMCDGQMQELWPVLMDNIQNHSADKLKQVAEQLKVEQENKEKYMMALVKLYQSQVEIIHTSGQFIGAEQKQAIDAEMKKLENLSNKGYRTGKFSLETEIPDSLFTTFLEETRRLHRRSLRLPTRRKWAQSGYLCSTPSTAHAEADAGISWS